MNFSVQLYELIRSKADEKTAQRAVSIVEGMISKSIDDTTKHLTTREDLIREVNRTREDLSKEILKSKEDTIKWMVGIFITLALMIIGLYLKK